MRAPQTVIAYGLNLLVVAAFAVFLGFALLKLTEIERGMRVDASENMLWVVSQTQREALRFDAAVARRTADAGPADVHLRYDMLASRLALLSEGPQARVLAALGFEAEFREVSREVAALEPLLHGLGPGEAGLARHVAETLDPLNALLGRAANAAMVAEWDGLGARLDESRDVVWQIIGSVVGITLSGALLSAHLLLTLRSARRTGQSLRREKQFSELLVGSSGEGILAIDAERRCTVWNAAMARMFSVAPEAAIGRRLAAISGLFEVEPVRRALTDSLAGEAAQPPEQAFFPEDRDEPLFLDLLTFPLRNGEEVVGAVAFVRDVTERHAAGQALARHRDELERLVAERTRDLDAARSQLVSAIETAPDGLAAFDGEGRMVMANSRLGDMLPGGAAPPPDGTALADLLADIARFAAEGMPDDHAARLADGGELRCDLLLPDGRWMQMTVKPIPDGGTIMRLADVTPYKTTAMELERALERERSVSEFYRGFASMVSHQFRTPLAIIDSSVQRLVRRGGRVTADEIAQRAARIRTGITRLTRLVESTLDAARLDTGQIEVKARPCDLAELARMSCERQREMTPDRDIVLVSELPPGSRALCDPTLVEHVIGNLLSNAVKYSPPGTPVEMRLGAGRDALRCAVTDRGVGVPEPEVPRLFERFFRASTASGVTGTGIGLNLSRALARLQDGDVTVETREGEGSTFTLHLPRALEDVACAPAA